MKPHSKLRKTIKWGGAAVTVLLVVVWIGSGKWEGGLLQGTASVVFVGQGSLVVDWLPPHPTTEVSWSFQRITEAPGTDKRAFGLEIGHWSFEHGELMVPLWCLPLLALLPTAVAWRLDAFARRRARLNLCPKCNYDRAGLAKGAVCPECGSKAEPA